MKVSMSIMDSFPRYRLYPRGLDKICPFQLVWLNRFYYKSFSNMYIDSPCNLQPKAKKSKRNRQLTISSIGYLSEGWRLRCLHHQFKIKNQLSFHSISIRIWRRLRQFSRRYSQCRRSAVNFPSTFCPGEGAGGLCHSLSLVGRSLRTPRL